jgi:hypothetical protein
MRAKYFNLSSRRVYFHTNLEAAVKKSSSQALLECENPAAIETEDQPGHSEDALATVSPWQHLEPEPQVWRGIFSPVYNWKVLFSQQVKIHPSELPHLKPHITIDRRVLEEEDD